MTARTIAAPSLSRNGLGVLNRNFWLVRRRRDDEAMLAKQGNMLYHSPLRLLKTIFDGIAHTRKPFQVARVKPKKVGVLSGFNDERVFHIDHRRSLIHPRQQLHELLFAFALVESHVLLHHLSSVH